MRRRTGEMLEKNKLSSPVWLRQKPCEYLCLRKSRSRSRKKVFGLERESPLGFPRQKNIPQTLFLRRNRKKKVETDTLGDKKGTLGSDLSTWFKYQEKAWQIPHLTEKRGGGKEDYQPCSSKVIISCL